MSTDRAPAGATFTADWFTPRIPQWEEHVVPRFRGRPCSWLEVGSYEGRSALWMLDEVLTHPDARITCVDAWGGPFERAFDANVGAHPGRDRVEKRKGPCLPILAGLLAEAGEGVARFDGAYVDADHEAKSALTQAALAWPMLRPGGLLIFDDYPWRHPDAADRRSKLPPRPGIDAFLECWGRELRLLHKGWQVIVEKL